MYIDPPETKSEETFPNVTANISNEELNKRLLEIRNKNAKESLASIQDSVGNIGIGINITLVRSFTVLLA